MADEVLPQIRPIITYSQAKALGLKRYFTGKPCKHGHVAERCVANCICAECGNGRVRARYAANPELGRQRSKRWRCANPEKQREQDRRRRERVPGRTREHKRQWKKRNPDKLRAMDHRRRARKRNSGGVFTVDDIKDIRKLQRNRCARCSKSLRGKKVHIDHIMPLARDGTNNRKNLQLLCAFCNCSKHDRDPIDDMRRLGRLL